MRERKRENEERWYSTMALESKKRKVIFAARELSRYKRRGCFRCNVYPVEGRFNKARRWMDESYRGRGQLHERERDEKARRSGERESARDARTRRVPKNRKCISFGERKYLEEVCR